MICGICSVMLTCIQKKVAAPAGPGFTAAGAAMPMLMRLTVQSTSRINWLAG